LTYLFLTYLFLTYLFLMFPSGNVAWVEAFTGP
jgi:hypothetical protein